MSKFQLLDDLIDHAYSVDLGLSEEEGRQLYIRMLGSSDWRARISAEVKLAFSDKNFSRKDFFDGHDIYSAHCESEARLYVEKIILEPLKLKNESGL